MQSEKHTNSKGFTIIELLIVIGIISILAAMLFPVFVRTTEKARAAACLSNLRNLSMGFAQYCEDYDEKFPNLQPWDTWDGDSWASKLIPYVKSPELFACPSDDRAPFSEYANCPYGKYLISYSYNGWLAGNMESFLTGTDMPNDDGIPEGRISEPSRVILIHDTPSPDPYTSMANPPYTEAFIAGLYTQSYRHNGGDNYAFADGHVKWCAVSMDVNGPDVYTDDFNKISFDYNYAP